MLTHGQPPVAAARRADGRADGCGVRATGGKGAHWWRARGWSEEAGAVAARDFDSRTKWLRHPKCLGGVFTESGVFPEFQEAKRVKDAEVALVRAATARKKEAIKAEWDANIKRAVEEKRQREAARRAHDAAAAGDAPEGRLTAAALAGHLWQSVVDAAKPAKMRG